MSTGNSGVKNHDDSVNSAEMTRQIAVAAAAGNAATIRNAEIVFHRVVVKSALANGCGVQPALQALRELGTGGT
jgi:hypothetical protein